MTPPERVVVDTSAAVAILTGEPGADWLAGILARAEGAVMAAATYLELSIMIEARFGAAQLTFGDCVVYGTAVEHDLPILGTGEDFARTDVPVLRPPDGQH